MSAADDCLSILEAWDILGERLVRTILTDLPLPVCVERVKVALDFRRRGPAFMFRALVEDWDRQRLNRELY